MAIGNKKSARKVRAELPQMSRRMALPSDDEQLLALSSALAEARHRIRELRLKLSANVISLFEEVGKFSNNPNVDLRSFLQDCGLPEEDFVAFKRFAKVIGADSNVLKSGRVKFETVKALISADQQTRSLVMSRIAAGEDIGVSDVMDIRRTNRATALSFEETVFSGCRNALREKGRSFGKATAAELRTKAHHLYSAMLANRTAWASDPLPGEMAVLGLQDRQIQEMARLTLTHFESLFGTTFSARANWAHLAIDNPSRMHLSQVHYSLKRLASGTFRKGRFPEDTTEFYSWSSIEAIQYLAGIPPERSTSQRRDTEQLCAVDLHAGAGGHALGLEAAGFQVAGMFDKDALNIKTLRANNSPTCYLGALTGNADADSTEVLTALKLARHKLRRIDLLSGTIGDSAWGAQRGAGRPVEGKPDGLTNALELVKKLKPRAFYFEIEAGYLTKRHSHARRAIKAELLEAGYTTKALPTVASQFGIPQLRKRAILIGISEGEFKLSELKMSRSRNLTAQECLAGIKFEDNSAIGTNSGLEAMERETGKVSQAGTWTAKYGETGSPDIKKLADIIYRNSFSISPWARTGFTDALEVGATANTSKVLLTVDVLKRLQGYPDDWVFCGEAKEQRAQALVATPPQVIAAFASGLRKLLRREQTLHVDDDAPTTEKRIQAFRFLPPERKDRHGFIVGEDRPKATTDRANAFSWQSHVDEEEEDWDVPRPLVNSVTAVAPPIFRPPMRSRA